MKRPFWADDGLIRRGLARSLIRTVGYALFLCLAASITISCATEVTAKQTAQIYYDLGNAYSRLGEQDKATAAYLNALQLDSSLLQASYNLARAYIEAKDYPKAFTLLESLLAKDPRNLTVLNTLGFAYYRKGDQKRALSYYEQVLGLSPLNENALYNKGTILSEQGDIEGALKTFTELYRLNSDSSLLFILGKLELAIGKPEEGIHELEAYRAAKPDDFDALKLLADAYRNEKLYDKALAVYDDALKVKPEAPGILFSKAEILLTAIQDEPNGLKALNAALAAGFDDRKAIDALLANPELVGKQAVESLLKEKNLFTPQAGPSPAGSPSKN